ncbi:hypothetical protein [Prochlorothrix hollandica]|uniref:hypothetical protein n=1 Tax=Prochlorothrix hollandica TaxID=1223 RepID=UPI000344A1BF|nr:hypothetical protein [Prochlorothrix hollandica]
MHTPVARSLVLSDRRLDRRLDRRFHPWAWVGLGLVLASLSGSPGFAQGRDRPSTATKGDLQPVETLFTLERLDPDPLVPELAVDRPLSPLERQQLARDLLDLDRQATAALAAGDGDTAFGLWFRELRLQRYLGDLAEVTALGRVGLIVWDQGKSQGVVAITERLKAIADQAIAAQTIPAPNTAPSPTAPPVLSPALTDALALAYTQVRALPQAIALHQQRLTAARDRRDPLGEVLALADLAQAYGGTLDYRSAAQTTRTLLDLIESQPTLDLYPLQQHRDVMAGNQTPAPLVSSPRRTTPRPTTPRRTITPGPGTVPSPDPAGGPALDPALDPALGTATPAAAPRPAAPGRTATAARRPSVTQARFREERHLRQDWVYFQEQDQNWAGAIAAQDQLIQFYAAAPLDSNLALKIPAVRVAQGENLERLGDEDRAISTYRQAYPLAQTLKQYDVAQGILHHLIDLHSRRGDDPDQILALYKTLLKVHQLADDAYGMLDTYQQLGQFYLDYDAPAAAQDIFQRSLSLAQRLKFREADITAQLEVLATPLETQLEQARTQGQGGDPTGAIAAYDHIYALAERFQRRDLQQQVLLDLISLQNSPSSASVTEPSATEQVIALYGRLISLYQGDSDDYGVLNTYEQLGQFYLETEAIEQHRTLARQNFQQALGMAEQMLYFSDRWTTEAPTLALRLMDLKSQIQEIDRQLKQQPETNP